MYVGVTLAPQKNIPTDAAELESDGATLIRPVDPEVSLSSYLLCNYNISDFIGGGFLFKVRW